MMFPTADHAEAARLVADFSSRFDNVDTILVVNSCARGQAIAESDQDMAILMTGSVNEAQLEADWRVHVEANATLLAFTHRSSFSAVHLDFFDGSFTP